MELCKPIKLAPQTNQTNFSISISGILQAIVINKKIAKNLILTKLN